MTDIVERLQAAIDMEPEAHSFEAMRDAKAEIERLRALLGKLRWTSIDKDNMEFRCDTTCFVMDDIRRALEHKP